MAINSEPIRFSPDDVERLLKALFPAGGPDPFGKLEELMIQLAEEIETGKKADESWQAEARDEMDDIKSRTFGILLLQIFKTISFFMRLLPQGKVILLLVAGIGLVQSLLSDGEVSSDAIKEAVRATGLNKFIDQVLAQIDGIVDEIAEDVSLLGDLISQVFVSVAGELEGIEGQLESEIGHLQGLLQARVEPTQEEAMRALEGALTSLQGVLPRVSMVTNSASNSDLVLGPAIRSQDTKIRSIPTLAVKLVRVA